jgi:hypothetical protein
VARNESGRVGEFLQHYRLLGVQRFFFVDNASTDGTSDFLMRQLDVDLFSTDDPFDWRRKHGWIDRLIDDHGRDRWYLLADADEHVVFAGNDTACLSDVTAAVASKGGTRVRGCLIDMYSQGPVLATYREPGTSMRDTYPYFDPGGYAEHRNSLLVSRTGGPRRRVLSKFTPAFEPQLTKYPLFHLCDGEVVANPHYIWPPDPNPEDRCYLGILHYKFDGDLLLKIGDAVERGQYWNDSAEYRTYQEALRREPLLTFHWTASRKYRSPDDFVHCELIEAILDGGRSGFDDVAQAAARQSRTARLAGLHSPSASRDRTSIASTK